MEMTVHIPFQDLLFAVSRLSPSQKAKIQKELAPKAKPIAKSTNLTKLLLNGPVFTEAQIHTIEETRKSINQWRTKS